MKSALVHAGLLAAALTLALVTWTADPEVVDADAPAVVVWDFPAAELSGISYVSEERSVEIERRSDDRGSYLWGTETFPTPPEFAVTGPVPADSARPAAMSSEQYPVAPEGDSLFVHLAALRAIRDLGEATGETRATYGLTEPEPALTLRFSGGEERTLVFGKQVPGGGSRYALDAQGGRIYVMPLGLVQPFETGIGTLRITNYRGFGEDDVHSVVVRADGRDVTMERRKVDNPPRVVWGAPGSESQDVAFGLHMQTLEGLWVLRYLPDLPPSELQILVRAEYLDWRGAPLGYLEILKRTDAGGAPVYYMRTPRTIVVGEIDRSQGERIEQDLRSLLGAARPAAEQ